MLQTNSREKINATHQCHNLVLLFTGAGVQVNAYCWHGDECMALDWLIPVARRQSDWMIACHRQWRLGVLAEGYGLLNLREFSPSFMITEILFTPLSPKYHILIWQVSPQLSCGDTCQIWMWLNRSNKYFCKREISVTEKLSYGVLINRTQVWHIARERTVVAKVL